jgi:uncharacterized protein
LLVTLTEYFETSHMSNFRFTNALAGESSPYLLQHAHNPVNWHPWGQQVIEKAKAEDKLLLVSIGYAACHWCHVMEHECFEDEEVAALMNENYISIKVDREERPDVDHYYMTAIHLTGSQGGWPLNFVALPDGKPLWGATYLPKENWMLALREISRLYRAQKDDTIRHATYLADSIRQSSLTINDGADAPATAQLIDNAVNKWKNHFDWVNGGRKGQPKFPMPVNLDFLLHYSHLRRDRELMNYLELTLEKMAMGGIYDQVGGGFARYSVDEKWKVPHFEKMLYDNGQLLTVYSNAYLQTRNPLFRQVVYDTVSFLEREMLHPSGAFYSSLDADSEGEEGKFYTWTRQELQSLLKEDFPLFAGYYNVNPTGHLEDDKYILLVTKSVHDFAVTVGTTEEAMYQKIGSWKKLLLKHRETRIRPGLDDKTLTSWNAIVISGLCSASKAFGGDRFRNLAIRNAHFLKDNLLAEFGGLYHAWKNGVSAIPGFLEDYALAIQAFISLYEITGDETWAFASKNLAEYSLEHFLDETRNMFLFNEKSQTGVLVNHFQVEDNVIASSNSVMAYNLLILSRLFSRHEWDTLARRMARNLVSAFSSYPYAHANWGKLFLLLTAGTREIAVVGENAGEVVAEMQQNLFPCATWASSFEESRIPMLKNRFVPGKTLIYICSNGSCRLPVETIDEALQLLR